MTEATPTTFTLDVVAANTIPFRVVFLDDGMSVSRPAANKYNTEGTPLVEFYDRRYDHTPDGQFVSAYHHDTLLADPAGGLLLYGGETDWSIDGATMELVRQWLHSLT